MSTKQPGWFPHGPIEEVFDDVFLVTGRYRMNSLVVITRNMVIVREGDALTLISSVRLSPKGERQLAGLGQVKHLVRIGIFHRLDDPYYVDRYHPRYWTLPGMTHSSGIKPDQLLDSGGSSPFSGLEVFQFRETTKPEGALVIKRSGGILITCDSIQNWEHTRHCSLAGKVAVRAMGLLKPAQIGPPWRKFMTPADSSLEGDFRRLAMLKFEHLISAHGVPLRDVARDRLMQTIEREYHCRN